MTDKWKKWCDGVRSNLSELVPMETPIAIDIEPSGICNFHCDFCLREIKDQNTRDFIDTKMFAVTLEQLKEFNGEISTLTFAGNGEPLTNPELPDLIKMAKQSGLFKNVKVFTNGSLLNEATSRKLIESGLDVLRISLQGISGDMVYQVSRFKMNYPKFLEAIKNFYELADGKTKLYIKVLDSQLVGEDTREKFLEVYSPICDNLYIEHLVHPDECDNNGMLTNMMNDKIAPFDVCSYPFYQMNITAGGNVYPCCLEVGASLVMGNLSSQTLKQIWDGEKWRDLRISLLERDHLCVECEKCGLVYSQYLQYEDNIDIKKAELLKYYKR